MGAQPPGDECLDEERALAFFSRRLEPAAFEAIERHLDGCEACRRLVSAIARFVTPPPSPPEPPVAEPPGPRRLGRYLLLDILGRGGMGVVYRAYDPELDRVVAVKVLRPGSNAGGDRLLREAQSLARIDHPNVVSVFDAGVEDGRVFIAMELVKGRTLRQWLQGERPKEREVLSAFLQAGHGLAAAHRAGVVHRDFKPDNVLVDDQGRVRVADFGLALVGEATEEPTRSEAGHAPAGTEDLTLTGQTLGTPAYMAPEQRRGSRVDHRSDQYALAKALHEALETCGAGTTSMRRSLRGVLERAQAQDPSDRFENLAMLLASLERRARPRWRRPLPVAMGVLAAVAFVSGGYAWNTSRALAECSGSPDALRGIWEAGPVYTSAEELFSHAAGTDYPGSSAITSLGSLGGSGQGREPARRTRVLAAVAEREGFEASAEVARRLDGRMAEVVDEQRAACLARRRAEISVATRDARMHCLEVLVAETDGLVDLLEQPGHPGDLQRLLDALLAPRVCRRAQPLAAPSPDAAVESEVGAVRRELARLAPAAVLGPNGERAADAEAALDEARRLGYQPLVAEALVRAGMLVPERQDARALLLEAVGTAERVGHDGARIEALIALASRSSPGDDASVILDLAFAALGRVSDPRLDRLAATARQKLEATRAREATRPVGDE